MKKILFCLFISILMACMVFGLVACNNTESNTPSDNNIPQDIFSATNPYGYKVGDQIPVYPSCEFNYLHVQDDEEYTFHIQSLSVTLVSKNEIIEGSTIDSIFFPYTVLICGEATVDRMYTYPRFDTCALITLRETSTNTIISSTTKINDDCSIQWNSEVKLSNLSSIQFYSVIFTYGF